MNGQHEMVVLKQISTVRSSSSLCDIGLPASFEHGTKTEHPHRREIAPALLLEMAFALIIWRLRHSCPILTLG